jgi:hypothetical protein
VSSEKKETMILITLERDETHMSTALNGVVRARCEPHKFRQRQPMPRMRAASARADAGRHMIPKPPASNPVVSTSFGATERGSRRTHVPMRNDGMRPASEHLPAQVSHDVRDVVIVGLEGEHKCAT